MSQKRRDKHNRVLRNGEIQLADGRYRYKYTDAFGDVRYVYSWRLDKNDRIIAGKKRELSLREKEKQITADIFDQIIPEGGKLTVLTLVEKYVSLRTGVRPSTEAGYRTVINFLKTDEFGKKRIDRVKISDAKAWLIRLQKEGKGYSSIKTIRGVVRPAFRMALEDDLIRKNPFDFELVNLLVNDSNTREALTREQQRKLLEFIKQDEHFERYYDGIYILFYTGLRISEFVGLTLSDIDFDNMKINVDHQLQRITRVGYVIEPTKTSSGTRQVPMTPEVAECFRRMIKRRNKPKLERVINGYSGFLSLDKNGNPMVALHWQKYMKHICQKYNSIYKVQMPEVTPHICRHTFCSNMAKSGMNPKTLQYIMGHSDIGVTLNTYTHLGFEDASEEMRRLSS